VTTKDGYSLVVNNITRSLVNHISSTKVEMVLLAFE